MVSLSRFTQSHLYSYYVLLYVASLSGWPILAKRLDLRIRSLYVFMTMVLTYGTTPQLFLNQPSAWLNRSPLSVSEWAATWLWKTNNLERRNVRAVVTTANPCPWRGTNVSVRLKFAIVINARWSLFARRWWPHRWLYGDTNNRTRRWASPVIRTVLRIWPQVRLIG